MDSDYYTVHGSFSGVRTFKTKQEAYEYVKTHCLTTWDSTKITIVKHVIVVEIDNPHSSYKPI